MFHCLFLRYALRMMNAQSGANLFELLLLLLFIFFGGRGHIVKTSQEIVLPFCSRPV